MISAKHKPYQGKNTIGQARKVNLCLMLDYTHVLDLNKTSSSNMLLSHLNLPLPMDTNPGDERNFLSGGAKMPVPYHLDESDSDSIVSSEDASYTELVPMSSGAGDEVKAGLRNAIKTRRVAQGLDGMPLIEAKKPRLEVLSKEEEEKRRIRRERNKVAAFKCRQRRKEHIQKLQDESDELNSERSCLEKELVALKAQKEQLERMFQSHNCILKNKTASEDHVSEAKSPHSCSVEMAKSNEPSSPTSPVPDSITA